MNWTVIGDAAAAEDESAVVAPIIRPNVVAASAVAANRGCVMMFRTCVTVVVLSPGAAGSKLQAVAAIVRAPPGGATSRADSIDRRARTYSPFGRSQSWG